MRILLAVDGSPSSDTAVDLVASFALPAGSTIRVVAVDEPDLTALAMTWGAADADLTGGDTDVRHLRRAIDRAERALGRLGVEVEGTLVRGRPGSSIVDEAYQRAANLVVLGSRGHGLIETMVLGSTAAEVVDHAPCPVLVARRARLDPIVLADDGSPSARHAEDIVATWPIFAGRDVTVVTVAETEVSLALAYAGHVDRVLESYTRALGEARSATDRAAMGVAQRLGAAGVHATADTLDGDPATELVRFAATNDTGTIVMGTRGHTGLKRLILGSTARNVLLHAPSSVLVVRQPR